jgi:predicted esterase
MNTPLTLPTDIFANVDKIHKVQCPILIIHGTADQVINISHGKVIVLCFEKFTTHSTSRSRLIQSNFVCLASETL